MDRPVAPATGNDYWAPAHVVLGRRAFALVGRLLVERDGTGAVLAHSPLAGMAAVEQRYPAWALGPFGHVEPERTPPGEPGVFALLQSGSARYVGASDDLARTFSDRGLGQISRRDAQRSAREEHCRLNRLVTAEAVAGRTVDLYVLPLPGSRGLLPGRSHGESPSDVAAQVRESVRGDWHLPT